MQVNILTGENLEGYALLLRSGHFLLGLFQMTFTFVYVFYNVCGLLLRSENMLIF